MTRVLVEMWVGLAGAGIIGAVTVALIAIARIRNLRRAADRRLESRVKAIDLEWESRIGELRGQLEEASQETEYIRASLYEAHEQRLEAEAHGENAVRRFQRVRGAEDVALERAERAEADLAKVRLRVEVLQRAQLDRPDPEETPDLGIQGVRGIGPVLAQRLTRIGLGTLQSLAVLSDADLHDIGDAIGVPPTKIRRERWIEQAKKLASTAVQDSAG
jgi:predicted flap endonuclease-1-like 5' DNA nuclease